MPLSEDVRAELAGIDPRRACCRLAELSALVRTAGSVHFRGSGRISLHLEVSSPAVARRAFTLLRSYEVSGEIRTFRRQAFEQATRFQIHIDDDARALQVLNEAGVLDSHLAPLERPPKRLVARPCCRAAYLRGALLAGGSVSGPRNAHLELRTANVEGAELLASLAAKDGFRLAVHDRGRHAVAYAKATDAIAELLAFLGAHQAALSLEESAVVASTRARANRLANADHANLVRSSRAAESQLSAIHRLQADGRLEHLPRELREVAELRARNPTLSLRELARRCKPRATKAAVHRRLAKIQKLAER
ncbi:MAG: DNA-binding protein WhiA [Gaiellaceae bacterium]